ncbi:TlpA family protein disulfide reductase [Flavobacterium sp.]|uniref:TlpA family protein disulfide reductase n=1 Tax=Flavobacterium sp. TaxID=239 RepID=UPI003F6A0F3B
MKKRISITVLIFALITILYFYNKFYGINDDKIIPNFKYENINGLKVEKKHFNPYKKTLIIYFNTDCYSCKNEILDKRIFELKENYNLIYITSELDIEKIKDFINYEELKKENISLLIDKNNDFASDFKIGLYYQYPLIISYDKRGRNKNIIGDISTLY